MKFLTVVRKYGSAVRPRLVAGAAALGSMAVLAGSAFADPPEVTTIADLSAYPPVLATKITTIIVAGLALFFGILVMRKGLSWISQSFKRA